jgi:uncharacterized membrane protein YphA (DoxX/SURF4 family)
MAGIDILNQFPNSKMAAAAQLGQSRFRSVESTSAITPAQKTGSAQLTGVAGNTSTAQLLTLCGLTTSFSEIMLTITTSVAGVVIAQSGNPGVRYPQGQSATFNDVTLTSNQLQIGTVAGDVVTINYVGV